MSSPSSIDDNPIENVVIIGSGPAGYTAALYCGRANLKPLLFEGIQSGPPGGQLMTTDEVENFPGFPEGITGPDLMAKMKAQATRWGAECVLEDVNEVSFSERPFTIKSSSGVVRAHAVIVCTGATALRLGLPSEEEFWSRGISACAICDGAAPIFKDRELGVVGGGDSAAEEACYLTKYSPKVHMLVRTPELSASKALQQRVKENPKVVVHYNTAVVDVIGSKRDQNRPQDESSLTGAQLRDTVTGEKRTLALGGLFYAIGHKPNTDIFRDKLSLGKGGYIETLQGTPQTSIPGVYAAGDVQDSKYRQAATAVGTGCAAALEAERYLTETGLGREIVQERATQTERASADTSSAGGNKEEMKESDSKSFDVAVTSHRGSYALRRLYHESDKPVIVKYVSPTCGPCRALNPILRKTVNELEERVHFVEIDITKNPEIAESAGVTGTPTVQVFYKKALVDTLRGVKMRSDYKAAVEKILLEQPS
ncbi:unnamed protein product [Chrysoparadoxa australica]